MSLDGLAVQVSSQTADVKSGIESVKRSFSSMGRAATSTAGSLDVLGGRAEETRDDALGLSVAMRGLASSVDEAEDELSSASRAATGASGSFGTLSLSTEGASIAMGSFSTVLIASVIPSVLTLSTVLAPLAATFATVATAAGSLAGVFGGIIGTGLLAWGKELSGQYETRLQQVRAQIRELEQLEDSVGSLTETQRQRLRQLEEQEQKLDDATTITGALTRRFAELGDEIAAVLIPFGQQFVPLVRDAVNAIPDLVGSMVEAIGSTGQFRESLRRLGGIAQNALPAMTARLFELAERALPVFNEAVAWMAENAGPAFDDLVATTEEIGPEFESLLDAVVDLAPELLEFGTNVADIVVPALEDMVSAGDDLLATVNDLDPAMRDLAITGTILAPALLKVSSGLLSLGTTLAGSGVVGSIGGLSGAMASLGTAASALAGPLGIVIGLVAALGTSYATNFGNIRSITNRTLGEVMDDLQRLAPVFRGVKQTVDKVWGAFGDEIETVAGFIVDSIGGIITTLTDFSATWLNVLADLAAGDFKEAVQEMEDFFIRTFNGLLTFAEKWGGRLIKQVVLGLGSSVNELGKPAQTAVAAALGITPGQLRGLGVASRTLEAKGAIADPTPDYTPQRPRRRNTEQRRERLEMKLDGRLTVEDGEVVALIDERIELDNNRTDRKVERLNERSV